MSAATAPADGTPSPAGSAGADGALRAALVESRQRWRDFVSLAADLAFETDAEGRLSFLSPDPALGWPGAVLLRQPVQALLANPDECPLPPRGGRGVKAWLRRRDGELRCFSLNLAPLQDAGGTITGLRGCGRDITEEERAAEAQSAALRRAGAVQALVGRIRREVLAPRMLATALEALPNALGCDGAVVLELAPARPPVIAHRHGGDPGPVLPHLPANAAAPVYGNTPAGLPFALLPQRESATPGHALLTWRGGAQRSFDADDRHLLEALSDLVFVVLGNQTLQRELEVQARTESLTGLANRRAFLADLRRRLERVENAAPGSSGALLFVDVDNFKAVNDVLGHDAGDAALQAVANLLRQSVRPSDLVGRFGGDEFVLWLDGADATAAAARASVICAAAETALPLLLRSAPTAISFSIGCAVHHAGSQEPLERLLNRADGAMYAAKREGRNRHVLAADALAMPAR